MKKLTIEFIRSEFKKEGYTLLTKEYRGSHQKLDYVCSGLGKHEHSISWSNWNSKKKYRCPYCAGKKNLTIEFIRAEFAKEGYTLLTTEYKNSEQKLDYICSGPERHKHSITWGHWNTSKRRCPYCANNAKLTIEFIRAEFAKEGYTLLTKIYKNSKQKLEYECPIGHRHSITWGNWESNERRCPYCNGVAKLTIGFIRSEFKKEGYTLLSTKYKNAHSKLYVECPKGHRYYVIWNSWQQGQRCPFCNNNISKWEKTVKGFLSELNIDHIPNDKTQLINPKTGRGLELDIWFPQWNKAVECNGLYWHSKPERKECDKIKQQLCKKQNINLLVITDKEWNQDIDKCKTKLINFIEAGV